MSTIVCQNLVSCETTIKLKLTSSPPHQPSAIDLSFLQSVPKNSSSYVHPLDNNSSFSRRLSAKSLELCTENLGSESGSDIITDDFTFFSKKREHKPKSLNQSDSNQIQKIKNFPPPLTSSLQVRRRSEGGRLIIEAVEAPFRNSYLQAERSDGRLRLCFLRCSSGVKSNGDRIEGENEFGNEEFEEEVKMEKFQRMRRCNNGDQGLCRDWKPTALWVASS